MGEIKKVVHSKLFQERYQQLVKVIPRLDEILSGIGHILERTPERFVVSDQKHLGVIKSKSYPDIPRIRVIYKFDDSEVELLILEETGDAEPFLG